MGKKKETLREAAKAQVKGLGWGALLEGVPSVKELEETSPIKAPEVTPPKAVPPLKQEKTFERRRKTRGVPQEGIPPEGIPSQGIPSQGIPFRGIPSQGTLPRHAPAAREPVKLSLGKRPRPNANFYQVDNDVDDKLAPLQTPFEHIVYRRLWRDSFGSKECKNYCRAGYSYLLKHTPLKSKNAVIAAVKGLLAKKHIIRILDEDYVSEGTLFRILRPEEILKGVTSEGIPLEGIPPQGIPLQDIVFADGIPSEGIPPEGTPSNSLKNKEILGIPSEGIPPQGTNIKQIQNKDIKTLSLEGLVDKFYNLLNQKPSHEKRERGIKEAKKLIQEGFSLEDLDYAILWVVRTYPDTGSFDRIPHFIDQALKDREEEKKALEAQRRLKVEEERRRAEEQQIEQERKRIEEVKASLPSEKLEELRQEALELLEREKVNVELGRETLLRLKMDELVTAKYLARSSGSHT